MLPPAPAAGPGSARDAEAELAAGLGCKAISVGQGEYRVVHLEMTPRMSEDRRRGAPVPTADGHHDHKASVVLLRATPSRRIGDSVLPLFSPLYATSKRRRISTSTIVRLSSVVTRQADNGFPLGTGGSCTAHVDVYMLHHFDCVGRGERETSYAVSGRSARWQNLALLALGLRGPYEARECGMGSAEI